MMKTKLRQILLSILPLAGLIAVRGADDIPQRPDFSRYNGMLEHSPFAVATIVAAPAATPNFAKDLYVANAAHTDQGDLVTVVSASDRNLREYLTTERPNEHGFAIASIQWSDEKGQTKVTITKDGQVATIGFNEALITQPSGNTSIPAPGSPNVMPTPFPTPVAPLNIPKPPQFPAVASPTPHQRPLIHRNPRTADDSGAPRPPPNMAPLALEE